MNTLSRLLLACLCAAVCGQASADEPLFGYVYTTDLLPDSKMEVAQWATWRTGKPVGDYDVVESRTEFEYGLTDRLQVAAYLNYAWASTYQDNVITGATQTPSSFANVAVGPNQRLNTTRFTGLSLEAIYRILSPYTDPVGLAVYIRPTAGAALRELESRLIVQKDFQDDRLVLAFNVGLIDDRQYLPNATGHTTSNIYEHPWTESSSLNLGLAGSYRFASNWSAGVELQNERGFSALTPFAAGARTNIVYYLGPSIHFAGRHLFATATYLDQLPIASDEAHTHPDFIVDGRNYSAAAERRRIRLKFGWYF